MKKLGIVMIMCCVAFFGFAIFAIAQNYLIGLGDTLYVIISGDEEWSGAVPISPDGSIALPKPLGVIEGVQGKTVKQIEELLTAKLSIYVKNPQITVSLRTREEGFLVHIIGEVKAPSFYRLPKETTLQELITQAGGPREYSDLRHIKIASQNEAGAITVRVVDFSQFLPGNNEIANPILNPNDVVFIPRISNKEYLSNIIGVLGSVKDPGILEVEGEMFFIDIILLRGGFLPDANLEKIQILSTDSGNQSFQVDAKKYLMEHNPKGNPIIKPGTVIFIPTTIIPTEPTIPVDVIGQVARPGVYRVSSGEARLTDAIFAAGGFSDMANTEEVKIIRQNEIEQTFFNLTEFLTKGDITQNPLLEENDTIVVKISKRAKQISSALDTAIVLYKTITVMGAVRNPGILQVSESASIPEVLTLAGGATPTADLERVTISRGGQKLKIDLRSVLTEGGFETIPPLNSGDFIFVPEAKESRWGQIVRFTGQISTMLGVLYVVTLIARYR